MSTAPTIALALLFFGAGSMKIAEIPQSLEVRDHLGLSPTTWRGIGLLEYAGVIGLLVGFAVEALGIAAAVGLTLLSLGAIASHIRVKDGAVHSAPAVLGVALSIAVVILSAS
jgi:hypothetical protein